MDRITAPLAADLLARTVEDGGVTFEARTLLPQTWQAGFAVAIGGAVIPAANLTAEALASVAKAVAGEYMTTYAGTWLNEGTVYIDAVRYFGPDQYLGAIAAGEAAGQKAIYDFTDGKDILL